MVGLARLLADPAALLNRAKAKAPEPLALRRVSAKLSGTAIDRKVEDLAAIQALIVDHVRSGRIGSLSRRQLHLGCQTLFQPPLALGRDPVISEPLVDEVERLKRHAAFFALLNAYLDAFSLEDPHIRRLGGRLTRMTPHWPWRETDTWPDKIKAYDLFEPDKAPAKISSAVLASDRPALAILEDAGLNTDGRRRGGLAEAAFREACMIVACQSGAACLMPQRRLIDWGEVRDGGFAFPRTWPQFAGALFLPWTAQEPPAAHKQLLVDSVLDYAGDPRVREARWRPVKQASDDAYRVIIRWLTKASVEQFFDIVSETMRDRPDMWAARRKFWTSYLKADLISAAWVAFGSAGALRADQAATRTGDKGLTMFGRLSSGGGRTAEHAALIMQIGDLTVVEWSHNGKWNIWTRGSKGRPTLFLHNDKHYPDYEPRELMGAPTNGSHTSNWQWKVADVIRRNTGLRP